MTINFGFLLIYSFGRFGTHNFLKPMQRIRCGFSSFADLKLVFTHTHTHTSTKMFVFVLCLRKYKLSSFQLRQWLVSCLPQFTNIFHRYVWREIYPNTYHHSQIIWSGLYIILEADTYTIFNFMYFILVW